MPEGLSANQVARQLFAGLPGRYDALAEALSFGQDNRWRRAMVRAVAPQLPGLVLDVATGTGSVALQLVSKGARVVGCDLSPDMLAQGARRLAAHREDEKVALALARGEDLPFPDATFDGLTFTYLLRYVEDPAATLRELARVVKPGGAVANLEFAVPRRPPWSHLWRLYTRAALPAAGLALGGRNWYEVGKFLGPSIEGFYERCPLTWQHDAWRRAGIGDVQSRVMSLGGGIVTWGHKEVTWGHKEPGPGPE